MLKTKKFGKTITLISEFTPNEIKRTLKAIDQKAIIKEDENGNALFYYSIGEKGALTKNSVVFDTTTEDGYAALQISCEKTLNEFLEDNMAALFHINSIEEFIKATLESTARNLNNLKTAAEEVVLTRNDICDAEACETEMEGDTENVEG